MSKMHYF